MPWSGRWAARAPIEGEQIGKAAREYGIEMIGRLPEGL